MNNWIVFHVHAFVITAGTDCLLEIQVHNLDTAVDILSTKLSIDSAELGSEDAATPFVVNGTNEIVLTNQVLRIDVDAIHTTTAADGLVFSIGFKSP